MRPQPPPLQSTTICATNDEVDAVNTFCLHSLHGPLYTFKSVDYGRRQWLNSVATRMLNVKVGAKVMLTVNINVKDKLVNGRTGIVTNVKSTHLAVIFENDSQPTIVRRFKFHTRTGSRLQYPLKLCWARTVHKTQSITIPGPVHIIATHITQPGQLAVALSRAQNESMISLSGTIHPPPNRPEIAAFYTFIAEVKCGVI